MKVWKLHKIEGSILKHRESFYPLAIAERRTTFGKSYGIKAKAVGFLGIRDGAAEHGPPDSGKAHDQEFYQL
jgi:hypothetical protein